MSQDADPPNTAAPATEGLVLGEVRSSSFTSDESLVVGDASGGSGGSGGGGAVSLTPQQLHTEILQEINDATGTPKVLLPATLDKIKQYDVLMANELLRLADTGTVPPTPTFEADFNKTMFALQQAIKPPKTSNGQTAWDELERTRFYVPAIRDGRLDSTGRSALTTKAAAAPAPLTTSPGAFVTASPTVPDPDDDEISTESKNKKPKKPFAPKPLNIFTDSMGNPLTTVGAVLAQMPNLMIFDMLKHAFFVRPLSVISAAVLGMGSTLAGVGVKGLVMVLLGGAKLLDLIPPGRNPSFADGVRGSYLNKKIADELLAYGKSNDRTLNGALHLGGTVLSLAGLTLAYPINAIRFNRFSAAYKKEQAHLAAFKATLSDDTKDPLKSLKAAIYADNVKYPTAADKADTYAKAKANEIKQGMAKERQEYRKANYKWTTSMEGALKYNATELYGDSFNNVINNAICLFMPMHVRNGIGLGIELALGVAALPLALISSSISALANKFGIKGSRMDAFNENVTGPLNGFLINRFMGALCRIGQIVVNPITGLMPSALGDGARRIMGGTFYKNHNDGDTNSNIASRVFFGFEEGQALADKIIRYAPDKFALVTVLEHTPNRAVNWIMSPVFLPLGALSYGMNLGLRLAKFLGAEGDRLNDAIEFSYNLAGSLTVDTVSGMLYGKTESRQFDLSKRVSEMGNLAKSMLSNGAEGTDTMLRNANAHLITGDTNPAAPAPVLSVPASSSSTTPTHVPGSAEISDPEQAVSASTVLTNRVTSSTPVGESAVGAGLVMTRLSRSQSQLSEEDSESPLQTESPLQKRASNIRSFFADPTGAAYRAITFTGTRRALGLTPARRIDPSPPLSFAREQNGGQVAPASPTPPQQRLDA